MQLEDEVTRLRTELAQLLDVVRQAQVEVDRRAPRRDLVPLRQAVVVFGEQALRKD
jgi:hypothetical protein